MSEGILITELIDELTRYAKTNPNARVRITDSPLNELEILSIYTDDDESVDFDNVWIDVGDMEEGCKGCTGCKKD